MLVLPATEDLPRLRRELAVRNRNRFLDDLEKNVIPLMVEGIMTVLIEDGVGPNTKKLMASFRIDSYAMRIYNSYLYEKYMNDELHSIALNLLNTAIEKSEWTATRIIEKQGRWEVNRTFNIILVHDTYISKQKRCIII